MEKPFWFLVKNEESMKKLLLIIAIAFFTGLQLVAQPDCFSVKVLLPQEDIPAEAKQHLISKLTQIATNYGAVDNGLADRFVLTADVLVSTKDIIPSNPPRISQTLDIILYIGDVVEDKVFSSVTLPVTGVAQNENKAFINAFQRIPTRSAVLSDWMTETREKILDYYKSNGEAVLSRADFLVASGDFDGAVASLLSISGITSVAETAREKILSILQEKIDREGLSLYEKAKNVWTVGQDENAAIEALELLSEIDPASKSAADAAELAVSIGRQMNSRRAKVEAEKQREFDFQMKKYEDDLEIRRQQLKDQSALERAKMEVLQSTSNKIVGIDMNKVAIVIKGWFGK